MKLFVHELYFCWDDENLSAVDASLALKETGKEVLGKGSECHGMKPGTFSPVSQRQQDPADLPDVLLHPHQLAAAVNLGITCPSLMLQIQA